MYIAKQRLPISMKTKIPSNNHWKYFLDCLFVFWKNKSTEWNVGVCFRWLVCVCVCLWWCTSIIYRLFVLENENDRMKINMIPDEYFPRTITLGRKICKWSSLTCSWLLRAQHEGVVLINEAGKLFSQPSSLGLPRASCFFHEKEESHVRNT